MATFIEVTKTSGDVMAIVVSSIDIFYPLVDPTDSLNKEKTYISLSSQKDIIVKEEYATIKTAINA